MLAGGMGAEASRAMERLGHQLASAYGEDATPWGAGGALAFEMLEFEGRSLRKVGGEGAER